MKNQIKHIFILFLLELIFSQGNFQILNIPSSTRMLSLSNAGHAMNHLVGSYSPSSINVEDKNINFHSHLYPAEILYLNTEAVLPINKYIFSFSYANLNYGEFKDAESNYLFNSSEFLFRGNIKTQIINKISIGSSIGYGINKISNEFSHALFISLGFRTQLDNPRFGFGISVNNAGRIIKNFTDIKEELPASLNISTFYSPKYFPGTLLFDISKFNTLDYLQIKGGIEIEINDYLFFRIGNSSNAFDLSDAYSSYFSGLSSGLGLATKNWNIDFGVFNLENAGIVTGISLLYKKNKLTK